MKGKSSSVAVVGAGPAGLACSEGLARLGHAVILIERREQLGGRPLELTSWPAEEAPEGHRGLDLLPSLVESLTTRDEIELLLGWETLGIRIEEGRPVLDLAQGDATEQRRVDAVVLATGRERRAPRAEEDERVWSAWRFEEALRSDPLELPPKAQGDEKYQVLFVQCCGSRAPAHGTPDCCATGCSVTLKQATALRMRCPEAAITILHNGLRLNREGEEVSLSRLRGLGAHVIGGLPGRIYPRRGFRVLQGCDVISGKRLFFEADLVVLASATVPRSIEGEATAFQEGPDRIFRCGALRHPCLVREAMGDGRDAAFRVDAMLETRR